MTPTIKHHLENLQNKDANSRYASFQYLIDETQKRVNWVYDAWENLLLLTENGDNHQRTIAVQLLSNLAKSDTEKRMSKDFKKLLKITKDEKFVTARHSLQCMWKIAIIPAFTATVIKGLKSRFEECISEKNGTLLRYDIIEVLRKIYDETKDAKIKEIAYKWIGQEDDEKYKKKYTTLWRDVIKAEK